MMLGISKVRPGGPDTPKVEFQRETGWHGLDERGVDISVETRIQQLRVSLDIEAGVRYRLNTVRVLR